MYMSYADIVTNADIMQDYTNYVPSVNINKGYLLFIVILYIIYNKK